MQRERPVRGTGNNENGGSEERPGKFEEREEGAAVS